MQSELPVLLRIVQVRRRPCRWSWPRRSWPARVCHGGRLRRRGDRLHGRGAHGSVRVDARDSPSGFGPAPGRSRTSFPPRPTERCSPASRRRGFAATPNVSPVGLSLDGTPEMQRTNRGCSFQDIDLDFFLPTGPSKSVKMTVSCETLPSLAEGIIHLQERGFKVHANLGYGIPWNDSQLDVFSRQLQDPRRVLPSTSRGRRPCRCWT